ncbi:protein rolling stone-like [Leguminivora glycinivorella]|uniref:protein rolling stone-like n=1 Tax=Leguminivora glycinivorella TaxID=1035111 RepID=UPI00200C38C5|nr:protein rolling stone-like [Leguminivora glycinivorella]
MLLVRAFESTLAFGILLWSLFEAAIPQWLVYLTTWGIIMVFAMAASGLYVSLCAAKKMIPEVGKPPWYVMLYWVLFNISVSLAIVVTLLYWRLLSENASKYGIHERYFWLETSLHGFNAVLVLIELFASRTPVRLAHIYQPLLLGVVYTIFSKIYQKAGGTGAHGEPYIYKFLDWSEPQVTLQTTIGVALMIIVLYVFLWALAFVRDWLSRLCCSTKQPIIEHIVPITV